MSERFSNVVRMWHRTEKGECHAWDISAEFWEGWKKGDFPLEHQMVFLPSGDHPAKGTRILCGTCGSKDINPITMREEFIGTSAREATKG